MAENQVATIALILWTALPQMGFLYSVKDVST